MNLCICFALGYSSRGSGEATGMDSALLKNLMTGAESSSQFIGGLVVALLYVVIGVLSAIGSIFVFRRVFQGRWEQIF
jgi:hypothetical protein